MRLERVEQLGPHGGLRRDLDLRQVEDDRPALGPEGGGVRDDVQDEVDDRGAEALAVAPPDVAVVEVEAARPVDPRRERELRPPVVDDPAPEEPLSPGVHLGRDRLGHGEEPRVHREREPEVALVVEAHRVDLAERVLAVEHPAVGARQQRVGDVPQPRLDRGARPRGRSGSLDPLAAEVGRDVGAVEPAGPCVLDAQRRARDRVARGGERDRRARGARAPAGDGRAAP